MKIISKLVSVAVMSTFIFGQNLTVFAQEDFGSYTSDSNYGSYSSPVNYGSYTSDTANYSSYSSSQSQSSIDFGSYSPEADYGSYSSPVNYGSYTSPDVNYGSYTSDTNYGSYTSPYNSGTYTPYNSGTYIPYNTGSYYSSPTSYGSVNYGTPVSYGYTNYGYTNYGNYSSPTIVTQQPVVITPTTSCPSGTSFVNGTCQINTVTCPAGTTLINNTCQVNTVTCPTGTVLVNGTCQSTVINQTCWDGSVIPSTQTCPSQYKTCMNGSMVPVTQTCYKVCSNGTTVPDSSTCYRTCPNGTTVPDYQSCPVVASYPWVDLNVNQTSVPYGGRVTLSWSSQNASYCTATNGWSGYRNTSGSEVIYNVYGQTIFTITCYNGQGAQVSDSVTVYTGSQNVSFNNVVTSPATQVTINSARCNGIGLIASGAPSTAWFEYGETPSLGRQTNTASIGSAYSAPFSNVLTNLRANTTYYCRAVMNNQYGTVKGSVVSFTTKNNKGTYVAPVAKKTTKKVVTKKTNEVICADGTIAKLSSEGSAKMLNAGEKLITAQLDKVSGNISPKSEVMYRLVYKNISDSRLNDVTVKVTIPQEFTFVSASAGNFDESTHTLTFTQSSFDSFNEGVITWKVNIPESVPLGKSVVTTGYISYTIPSDKNVPLQDEVTVYSVGSITPNNGTIDTGAKKVVGNGVGGFLPDSLVEWLALIAIMAILVILGRSIYATYKDEEKKEEHH